MQNVVVFLFILRGPEFLQQRQLQIPASGVSPRTLPGRSPTSFIVFVFELLPLVTSGVMLLCPLFRRCNFTIRTDMLFKFQGRRFGALATCLCRCYFAIATTVGDGWSPHRSDERPTAAAGTSFTAARRGGQQGGIRRGRS